MFNISQYFLDTTNAFEARLAKLSSKKRLIKGTMTCFNTNTTTEQIDVSGSNAKPIMVLLHGFSSDKYIWNRIAKHLTNDYQLIIPNLLGHGDTPYDPSQSYSVPNQCEHLICLLDELGVNSFIVVGNSMGGMMAAYLLKTHLSRIQAAVLLDPAGAKTEFAISMSQKGFNPFIHPNLDSFKQFFAMTMHSPPFIPNMILNHVGNTYIAKQAQYKHMFSDFFNIDDFFEMNDYIHTDKALLIWGKEDCLLPVSDHVCWESVLVTKALIYDGVGHMPMVEDVTHCAQDIKTFLKARAL